VKACLPEEPEDIYEYSEFERNNLVYSFSALTKEEAGEKKLNLEKFNAEKEAAKMKQAAPEPEKKQDKNEKESE